MRRLAPAQGHRDLVAPANVLRRPALRAREGRLVGWHAHAHLEALGAPREQALLLQPGLEARLGDELRRPVVLVLA